MDTKKIDETIEVLCEKITAEAKNGVFYETLPDTITALAQLITARAAFQNMTTSDVQKTVDIVCAEIAEQMQGILPVIPQ